MENELNKQAYTAAQVTAMDKYTIEELGVDILQLMEVAGLEAAKIAADVFPKGGTVTVLTGTGGNGGDALVAAKWLRNWGYTPQVVLSTPTEKLSDVTRHQLNIYERLGGSVIDSPPQNANCIIDGLLGYSLHGAPREAAAELINWANNQHATVVALDLPSGLDATTGEIYEPAITADHTVTFGVMKAGLQSERGKSIAGHIHIVDIGFPTNFPSTVLNS